MEHTFSLGLFITIPMITGFVLSMPMFFKQINRWFHSLKTPPYAISDDKQGLLWLLFWIFHGINYQQLYINQKGLFITGPMFTQLIIIILLTLMVISTTLIGLYTTTIMCLMALTLHIYQGFIILPIVNNVAYYLQLVWISYTFLTTLSYAVLNGDKRYPHEKLT